MSIPAGSAEMVSQGCEDVVGIGSTLVVLALVGISTPCSCLNEQIAIAAFRRLRRRVPEIPRRSAHLRRCVRWDPGCEPRSCSRGVATRRGPAGWRTPNFVESPIAQVSEEDAPISPLALHPVGGTCASMLLPPVETCHVPRKWGVVTQAGFEPATSSFGG